MTGDGKHNPMNPTQCRAWSSIEKQKPKMKTAIKSAQHGDVTLKRLAVMPEGQPKKIARQKRGWVLADGEVTGHQHVIDSDDAELIEIGGRMLLVLEKAATVTHEEHLPITLQPGIWEVGRVQEYDYLTQMTRAVAD